MPGEPHKYNDVQVLLSTACEIELEIFINACALHGKRVGKAAFGCKAAKAAAVLKVLIELVGSSTYVLSVSEGYMCSKCFRDEYNE